MAKPAYETEVTIQNPEGLHMRPAMQFVDLANTFDAELSVNNGDVSVDAKSIMQMTMLGATCGTCLTIRGTGPDACQAVDALRELLAGAGAGDSAAVSGRGQPRAPRLLHQRRHEVRRRTGRLPDVPRRLLPLG